MKFSLLLLALLSASISFAQEKERISQSDLRSGLDKQLAQNCAEKRARLDRIDPNKSPGMAEQARADIELWCNCMPAEAVPALERLGDPVPPEKAMEVVWRTGASCAGKGQRAQIIIQCPSDPETVARVSDVGAYCACVGSNIAKLDDIDLRQQTEKANNEAINQWKAAGRKGKGPLSPIPPAIRHFGQGCEKAVVSENKKSAVTLTP